MFGDWHLALAAYNWGEGNVQRAIKRNQRAGLRTDYSSLKMPAETRDYVPKLQAMKNIVANPQTFSLTLPTLRNHPYFLSVPIARDIDVALAARLADLPLAEFQALNPQMNKPVILAAGTPRVLLPYDNASSFLKAVEAHRGPLATWTAWIAPKTMKTAQVAQQVGMAEDELREVNRIPPHMLVKAGSTLLVPRTPQRQADVSEKVAENATHGAGTRWARCPAGGVPRRQEGRQRGRRGQALPRQRRAGGAVEQTSARRATLPPAVPWWSSCRAPRQGGAGAHRIAQGGESARGGEQARRQTRQQACQGRCSAECDAKR